MAFFSLAQHYLFVSQYNSNRPQIVATMVHLDLKVHIR